MKRLWLWVLVSLIIPGAHAAELIEGIAYRLPQRTEAYREEHRRTALDHRVEYWSPQGVRFAELVLDYRCSAIAPAFEQRDARTRSVTGARWESGSYLLIRDDERRSVPAGPELVASSGFDSFVARHWSALHSGRELAFEFALPAQLRTLRMRMSRVSPADEGGALRLRIEPAQPLLRRLVDPVELVYDRERRLQVFRGRSNLSDENGAKLNVEIHYRHSSAKAPGSAMKTEPPGLAERTPVHTHCGRTDS